MNIDPMKSLQTLHRVGPLYASSKATRVFLEESLRSTKALQMKASDEQTAAAQEREAYASEAYRTQLEGLKVAVEQEEGFRWQLITAQAAIEVYRTMEASNRRLDKAAT